MSPIPQAWTSLVGRRSSPKLCVRVGVIVVAMTSSAEASRRIESAYDALSTVCAADVKAREVEAHLGQLRNTVRPSSKSYPRVTTRTFSRGGIEISRFESGRVFVTKLSVSPPPVELLGSTDAEQLKIMGFTVEGEDKLDYGDGYARMTVTLSEDRRQAVKAEWECGVD